MQTVSKRDDLHERSKAIFWEKIKKKTTSKYHLLKLLSSMLSV